MKILKVLAILGLGLAFVPKTWACVRADGVANWNKPESELTDTDRGRSAAAQAQADTLCEVFNDFTSTINVKGEEDAWTVTIETLTVSSFLSLSRIDLKKLLRIASDPILGVYPGVTVTVQIRPVRIGQIAPFRIVATATTKGSITIVKAE